MPEVARTAVREQITHEDGGRHVTSPADVEKTVTSSPVSYPQAPGKAPGMDRNELLDAMLRASSPNETSTAICDARTWLATRADDQKVLSAMEDLIEVERQSFG